MRILLIFSVRKNSLSLFHINKCSLSKSFDDLELLLKSTNKSFAVPETRLTKTMSQLCNGNLKKLKNSVELTPAESAAVATLLDIAYNLIYINYKA